MAVGSNGDHALVGGRRLYTVRSASPRQAPHPISREGPAATHARAEAGPFLALARQNVLHQLVRVAAPVCGGERQFRFQFSIRLAPDAFR
jgi:hypothetical protein